LTAEQVAEHLDARRAGPGKWQAKCPAHDDRSPSLSIKEGHDGKVLLRCWAGCDLAAVLKASGLTMANLFAGPPPSPEQLQALAQEREAKRIIADRERQARRQAREKVEKLSAIVNALGAKLAAHPESDPLSKLFHQACDRLHLAEHEVEGSTDPYFVSFVYFVPAQAVGREETQHECTPCIA
jgi:hypothetical protein